MQSRRHGGRSDHHHLVSPSPVSPLKQRNSGGGATTTDGGADGTYSVRHQLDFGGSDAKPARVSGGRKSGSSNDHFDATKATRKHHTTEDEYPMNHIESVVHDESLFLPWGDEELSDPPTLGSELRGALHNVHRRSLRKLEATLHRALPGRPVTQLLQSIERDALMEYLEYTHAIHQQLEESNEFAAKVMEAMELRRDTNKQLKRRLAEAEAKVARLQAEQHNRSIGHSPPTPKHNSDRPAIGAPTSATVERKSLPQHNATARDAVSELLHDAHMAEKDAEIEALRAQLEEVRLSQQKRESVQPKMSRVSGYDQDSEGVSVPKPTSTPPPQQPKSSNRASAVPPLSSTDAALEFQREMEAFRREMAALSQ